MPRARRQPKNAGGETPPPPMANEAAAPAATPPSHSPASPPQSRLDRITQRAYAIYERRGGTDGNSMEDWLQAEREIDAEA